MCYIGELNISTTGDVTLGVVRGDQMSLTCNGALLKAKVVALVPFYIDLHVCLWMYVCTPKLVATVQSHLGVQFIKFRNYKLRTSLWSAR